MPRNGELSFYETIGEAGREFCRNKPFSLDECGIELMQIGAIMTLLPPPPARILECGCGAGWLSKLLAKRGYDVVGTDVSSQAIEIANSDRKGVELSNPTFVVADTEELPFTAEFDVVIFYDSLHHAIDERESLVAAFRALKPGGICITSEPGRGHEARSRAVIEEFDVTEKDMPPSYVAKIGREVGFSSSKFYPRMDHLGRLLCETKWTALGRLQSLRSIWPFKYLMVIYLMMFAKRHYGIMILSKALTVDPAHPFAGPHQRISSGKVVHHAVSHR